MGSLEHEIATRFALVREGSFELSQEQIDTVLMKLELGRDFYRRRESRDGMIQASTSAPAVFIRAVNASILSLANGKPLPLDDSHLSTALGTNVVDAIIKMLAEGLGTSGKEIGGLQFCRTTHTRMVASSMKPLYKAELEGVRGRRTTLRYAFTQEFWFQLLHCTTRGHVDHQAVLACVPRYCRGAVKVWAFLLDPSDARAVLRARPPTEVEDFMMAVRMPSAVVVVMRPGDVVVVPPNTWHAVTLGYCRGTPAAQRYCVIGGNVFALKSTMLASYEYGVAGLSTKRRLSSACTARYEDGLLYPYWCLYHPREEFDAARALESLRSLLHPPGTRARQCETSGAVPRKMVAKRARMAKAAAAQRRWRSHQGHSSRAD